MYTIKLINNFTATNMFRNLDQFIQVTFLIPHIFRGHENVPLYFL